MITEKILPAHILRLYCWEILKVHTSMSIIEPHSLVPIIPIEDEPKVADSGKPYAIYGYSESAPQRDPDQVHQGIFTMRVISPTFSELGEIMNVISLAFESTDVATESVNRYSSNFPNEALTGIRFMHTRILYVEGGEAPETEGGPVDGMASVSYSYINNLPTPVVLGATRGLWS